MGLDDALRDGEAQAGARDVTGGLALHAIELLEDVRQGRGGDAETSVGQGDHHRGGRGGGIGHRDGDRHRAAGTRVLHGIAPEIEQRLLDPTGVRRHGHVLGHLDGDRDIPSLGLRLKRRHHVGHERVEIHLLGRELEARFDLPEIEQVGDQLRHVVGRLHDALAPCGKARIGGPGPEEQLGGRVDDRERVLQVVRHRPDQLVLHVLELFEQGDVAEDGGQAHHLAIGRAHGYHARLGRAPVGQRHLSRPRAPRFQQRAERLLRQRIGEREAGDGLGLEVQHRPDGGVGEEHDTVLVGHDDGVLHAADHRGERAPLIRQGLVGARRLERGGEAGSHERGNLNVVGRVGAGLAGGKAQGPQHVPASPHRRDEGRPEAAGDPAPLELGRVIQLGAEIAHDHSP